MVKNIFNSNVQILRTYNGCEFSNSQFDELVKENGIIHQSSCVYTPQQNGVVERKHRSILKVARSLSPKVTDKLSARAIPAVLMGYSSTQKGYKLYDLHAKTFFVSKNVVFKEDLFPFKYFTPSTSHLFPVLEPSIHNQPLSDFQPCDSQPTQEEGNTSLASFPSIPSNTADQLSVPSNTAEQPTANDSVISHAPATTEQSTESLRKSSITVKQPLWLQDYVTTKASNYVYPISSYISYDQLTSSYKTALNSYSSILEPSTFKEAAAYPKWIEAMRLEIACLEENNT
ncbi:uncharacterized protein LOC107761995 [Nicotiana tabacum]|uniref:Uncharacterized protein LOC107761995 n=1 Tax=Nicotiana tabacum TaxID=4097 RepID=A0A1S3X7B2_TOBAC